MLGKAIGVISIADVYAGILDIIDKFDLMKVYKEKEYKSKARKNLRKILPLKSRTKTLLL